MYHVVARHLFTGEKLAFVEVEDAGKAYELAHSMDAEIHFGDEDGEGKWMCPTTVRIEDEDGHDKWDYCCRKRCPSAGLLE